MSEPIFFAGHAEFRAWLEKHHDTEDEVIVGFHKKATGKQTMSWAESVDEALCFGWIDGVRRPIDEHSYAQRFTPRRKRSIWSTRNIARVEALKSEGRMTPAGLAAFEARDPARSEIYSHEKGRGKLTPEYEERLRANAKAWEFFSAQPPGYRRTAGHWVMQAKREETRERRLGTLIADSEAGRRIGLLRRPRGG
jgi:uncharacterized protein YdeI (YjbR/CyaY-like superfamily)